MRNSPWRFLIMIIFGIVLSLILNATVGFPENDHLFLYDIFLTAGITILIWEGSLRIDTWLNRILPWVKNAPKRIVVQFCITLIFSGIGIFVPMLLFNRFVCANPLAQEFHLFIISFLIGLFVTFFILIIEISAHFFMNWKQSLVEVEKYKHESTQAQLKNLQEHVNPHFLFNNLSVLSSLVKKDPDKAQDFISQLSKVYRYILENKNKEIVTIQSELDFIDSYIFLLKIRFENSLILKESIKNEIKNQFIPPMVLQLLIENCIKHNEISRENPLTISISNDSDYLIISNNLQIRKNTESESKTGIENIKKRYSYLSDKEVIVRMRQVEFEVKIPILNLTE